MFKVVFLLDCDECGQSFDRASVMEINCLAVISTLTELQKRGLERNCEWFGWKVFRNHCICPNCILEEEKMADWYSEEEEYKS